MKYSIITVNYNDAQGLEDTIKSVVSQTYNDYEFIIIDGGSTDDSKYIIEENQSQIDYWVSEPDKGIFNAMNKGILASKGDYLIFMNSGDCFYNEKVLDPQWCREQLRIYTEDICRYSSLDSLFSTLKHGTFRMNGLPGMNDKDEGLLSWNLINVVNKLPTDTVKRRKGLINNAFIISYSLL